MPQNKLSIRIDGELVAAREGQTILEAARASGKHIPTLCYLKGLSAIGSCRLCIVEVFGVGRLLPSCTTPVQDGMSITTKSAKLDQYRRIAIELLLVERNHVCAVCVSNGHCELQSLALAMGVTHARYPYNFPDLPVDASHERYVLDHNRCVLCTRCARVCREIEGAHVWEVARRGIHSILISDLFQPWGLSRSCTSCGKCVQVCPTGALFEKGRSVAEMEKRRDFLPYLQLMRREHE